MPRKIIQPGGIPAVVPDSYGAPSPSSLTNGRPAFHRPSQRQGIRDTGRTTKPLGAPITESATVLPAVNPVNSLVSPDGLVRGARNQALARNLYRRQLKLLQSQSPTASPTDLHNQAVSALGFTPPGISPPGPSVQPIPNTIGPPSGAPRPRRPQPSGVGSIPSRLYRKNALINELPRQSPASQRPRTLLPRTQRLT